MLNMVLIDMCAFLNEHRSKARVEKVTHMTGRLPDQAVILFNYVRFQNGNFS